MRKNIILAAGVFMVFLCAQSVRADMFSFPKSMGGTIADVRPNAISLTPSNAGQNQTPVDVEIDNSTKLKDLRAVSDLKPGDAIQVKYKEQNGRKVAVQVEKDMNAQANVNADANAAANAGAASTVTSSTTVSHEGEVSIPDTNTPGSRNTAEDQMLKTNQGTNMGAANKLSPGTDQSGAESSSQFAPGSSLQDQANQGETASSTTTYQAVDANGRVIADDNGAVRSSDPTTAEGTPASQR